MVLFNGSMYVGSTSLHRYNNGNWDQSFPQPPGKIRDLAATTDHLYALIGDDYNFELYRWSGGSGVWQLVPFSNTGYPDLQSIYGTTKSDGTPNSNYLFVGSRGPNSPAGTTDYAVFYISGSGSITGPVAQATGLLTGAAYDDTSSSEHHYFSTSGGGIYEGSGSSPTAFTKITSNAFVKGMICISSTLPDKIVALCYDGDILSVGSSSAVKLNSNPGYPFTGPAAVWRIGSPTTNQLLLVAVQTSDTTYGYREIPLYTGPLSTLSAGQVTFQMPGTGTSANSSTMDDSKRYQDTIEPKPLNAIFQAPDMTLFASVQGTGTSKDDTDGGLWSYRVRDGAPQWNAE
jgi:hypothetical protein